MHMAVLSHFPEPPPVIYPQMVTILDQDNIFENTDDWLALNQGNYDENIYSTTPPTYNDPHQHMNLHLPMIRISNSHRARQRPRPQQAVSVTASIACSRTAQLPFTLPNEVTCTDLDPQTHAYHVGLTGIYVGFYGV